MRKRIKELEQTLDRRSQEGEALRARIAQLETELSQTQDELSNTEFELSKCKRSLEDFRSRSEAIVNALTEAHNTRERILKDARNAANNITMDANGVKKRMLDEAQKTLDKAQSEARTLIDETNAEAQLTIDNANAEAQALVSQAQARSEAIITEAEAAAERIRADADIEIEDKRNILESLNQTIRRKAAEVIEQSEAYAALLEQIASAEPAQCEPERADGGSEADSTTQTTGLNSEDPCGNTEFNDRAGESDGKLQPAPCGRETPCCFAHRDEETGSGSDSSDEAEPQELSAPPSDLPESYDSPATLMRSIYSIEGRSIPEVPKAEDDCGAKADSEPVCDVGDATPLIVSPDEVEADCSDMPVDDGLESLIDEILRK